MRISAAANKAPAGGLGGVIDIVAIIEAVPLGAAGIACTERVDASS